AHVHQPSLHVEKLGKLVVPGPGEDLLLQLVYAVVKIRQPGEETVDQALHDVVEEDQPRRPASADGQAAMSAQPVPQLVERVAVFLPDGDQVVLGDEDMDLGDVVPALPGDTVANQVDDIAEVLHPGSLAELADSFDRQRM